MATQEKTWNVANRLHSLKDSDNPEVNHIIAGADEIYDDTKGAKQSDINAQTDAALADRYTKAETYSKEQLDSLITTPDANYVTVATFADLPQTGEANTIYRVSSYDGTQVDASKYALYAWNGATYQLLAVRSAVGEVFDVSEYNSGATYETLTAALAAVPASVQRGGMSIKFILRTNTGTEEEPVYHDEYVLYRLMNTDWSTVITDWQGVDKVPTPGSHNFVESGGVQNELALGAIYDVSAKNPTAGPNNDGKFESLSALLSDANLNTLIPTAVRKGGMSIKFVQSSDNKYVQYRYTETYNGNTYEENQKFINTQNWQKQGAEVSVLQNSLMIGNNKQCSVGIEDSSVLFSNTGFIKSDGTIGSNADYVCTDFLPYNGGNILLYGASGTNACLIVYYDKTRTSILGYLNGTQYDNTSVVINSSDIPQGTAYVRVSGHANSMSNCYSNFAFFGEGKVGLELALYLDWGSRNSNLIGYIPNSKRLHTKRIQVPFMLKVKSDYIIKSIMKYNNGAYKSADTINITQLVCIPNNTYNEVIVNIEKSDNSAITDFDCVDFFVQGIDAIPIDIKAIGLDTYLTNILNIGEFGLKNSGEIALIISNGNLVTFPISIGKKITYKGVELYYNGSNKWTINKDGLQRMVWPERDNALYSYSSGVISQGQVNASWFSKRFKVSVGDFVVIKGSGGSGARLWALTDENNNVIEVASSGYEAVQYNIVRASSDGYIFVNATKETFEVWITKEMAERFELPIKGMPKLQIDTTADVMVDLSTEIDGVRFYSVYLMQAIIDKFDALITAYPNYVTKTDVVTFINDTLHSTNPLSYPEYANGVTDYHTGDGHVDKYRTYIYKVTLPQTNLGKADQNPRKKILLLGGVHGSELTSQFNCYLFAYNLLHNAIQDNNLFKLLSCADIYIIPTLNGYGTVVGTRVNANGVNINRNYPSRLWSASGTPYNADYTGPTAGSEFEAQIVMQLIQYLKPEIVLDHHNYWGAAHQLYFEFDGLRSNDCCYRAAVDISQKALKEMPEYFGTKPFILTNDNSIIRGIYEEQGRMPTWLRDYDKNILSCTCEISASINYVNGVNQVATTVPENGTDVFKVGELTLRETIYSFLNMSLAIK